MAARGVESVRAAVFWDEAQPFATAADVPPEAAARFRDAGRSADGLHAHGRGGGGGRGARHERPSRPPAQPGVGGAARRATPPPPRPTRPRSRRSPPRSCSATGPAGSFWAERPELPRVPVRDWQIWNEPNLPGFWSAQPFAPSYLRLLRAARAAIRAADPGARVILAGLPNYSWRALRAIYRAGGRGAFDAVALHPFTGPPRFVMKLIRLARAEMARNGDRRLPVWVTELSWPASAGQAAAPGRLRGHGRAARRRGSARRCGGCATRACAWGSSGCTGTRGCRRRRGRARSTGPACGGCAAPGWRARRRCDVFARWARRLEGCAKVPGDARRCR